MLTLKGQAALVTGGSRGIGRAVSVLFGRLGARVAVGYARDERAALETVRLVHDAGGEAFVLRADVARAEEAQRLVAEAEARLAGLDVVVLSHGIWKRASLVEMTPKDWRETLSVNLDGVYAVCHHAARAMVGRRRGRLIVVASTSGQRAEAHYSHYSATKGAVIAFTRSLAAELAPDGVRVNAVAPGWVLTDMSREALEGPTGREALSRIPLGRPATPEEIAGPVAFLASDLSSYVVGEVLCVNGGAVMVG